MRTIAVINQKGGVGKTTTVANLGAAVADSGRGVCLIDLDPQAHLTLHFGLEPSDDQPGMYEVLSGDAKLTEALRQVRESLSLAPSSIDLAGAEVEMVNTVGREQVLRDALAEADLKYDFAFIDCPPSLGLLTLNALAAADEVVIPLQPHFLALQGLGKLLETVSLVQRRINPTLRVSGVILCMYETTTRLAGEVRDDLRDFLASARGGDAPWSDAHVFETFIRRNVKLAECPSYGTTIFDYDVSSHGAKDYAALAAEFLSLTTALPVRREDVPQQYVPQWAVRDVADASSPDSRQQSSEPRE
ncbi:MAG: ParA family protein [Phycisphaerae bacterium]